MVYFKLVSAQNEQTRFVKIHNFIFGIGVLDYANWKQKDFGQLRCAIFHSCIFTSAV